MCVYSCALVSSQLSLLGAYDTKAHKRLRPKPLYPCTQHCSVESPEPGDGAMPTPIVALDLIPPAQLGEVEARRSKLISTQYPVPTHGYSESEPPTTPHYATLRRSGSHPSRTAWRIRSSKSKLMGTHPPTAAPCAVLWALPQAVSHLRTGRARTTANANGSLRWGLRGGCGASGARRLDFVCPERAILHLHLHRPLGSLRQMDLASYARSASESKARSGCACGRLWACPASRRAPPTHLIRPSPPRTRPGAPTPFAPATLHFDVQTVWAPSTNQP